MSLTSSDGGTEERIAPPTESLGVSIALQVAELEGCRPIDLPKTLEEVVDVDALDSLFHPPGDAPRAIEGRLRFGYCGYEVVVYDDGRFSVRPGRA